MRKPLSDLGQNFATALTVLPALRQLLPGPHWGIGVKLRILNPSCIKILFRALKARGSKAQGEGCEAAETLGYCMQIIVSPERRNSLRRPYRADA